MPSNGFRAIERGFSERLILIAGWGFSGDVFTSLELPCNYLIIENVGDFVSDARCFVERLTQALDECRDRSAHLLGWSLGAHAAIAWALANPQRVASLHLAAIRPSYPADVIEHERQALTANPAAHLAHFYRRVFLSDDAVRASFDAASAVSHVLSADGVVRLDEQLAFLARATITPDDLRRTQAVLWHGKRDKIAPFQQADDLAAEAESECHLFARGGHAVGFTAEFESRWSEWLVERGEQNF